MALHRRALSVCRRAFPVVSGVPALVDFEHSVLDADRLRRSRAPRSPTGRGSRRAESVYTRQHHRAANVARMLRIAPRRRCHGRPRPRILVIGGGTVGAGLEDLYADPTVDLICFDIYASPAVQFVADGHAIPLAVGCLDGVVVQAVLEHVLEPTMVAQEIHRVLRAGGSSMPTRRSSSRCTRDPTTSPASPTAGTGTYSAASSGSTPAR